jgi:SWI/SNF related-matrix-associated actin-dependent regulator of chromatin subfamily C
MKNIVNSMIDIQLNKLECKLQYLEEYEKLILYERSQLEVFQRFNIAETVKLAYKRNELNK